MSATKIWIIVKILDHTLAWTDLQQWGDLEYATKFTDRKKYLLPFGGKWVAVATDPNPNSNPNPNYDWSEGPFYHAPGHPGCAVT